MKFTTAAAASALAAISAASPLAAATNDIVKPNQVFNVIADAPGTDFDGLWWQASRNALLMGSTNQTAQCGPKPHNYADFVIADDALYLYTENPPQQMAVYRDGMGRGLIQYTTGVQPAGRNSERTTFAVNDEGDLVFRTDNAGDIGFQACTPAAGAKYSVWLQGDDNPAGFDKCVKFKARAVLAVNAVKCYYTEYTG